jgi:hypothetical protein
MKNPFSVGEHVYPRAMERGDWTRAKRGA